MAHLVAKPKTTTQPEMVIIPGWPSLEKQVVVNIFEWYITLCQQDAPTFRRIRNMERRKEGDGEEDSEEEGEGGGAGGQGAGVGRIPLDAEVSPHLHWKMKSPFYGWIRTLSLVCKGWKNFLDDNPTFFRAVRAIDMASADACFGRPGVEVWNVEIYFNGNYLLVNRWEDEFRALWKRILLEEAGRIKRLTIDFDWGYMDGSMKLIGPDGYGCASGLRIFTLGRPQFLALEDLTLRCLEKTGGLTHVAPFLHYSELPALRSLTTYRIPLAKLAQIQYEPSNITKLSLTQALDHHPDGSFRRLLDILAAMPKLASLSLDRALADKDLEEGRTAEVTPISLPELKTLTFVGHISASNAALFLDSIDYPPNVVLELAVRLQMTSGGRDDCLEEQELTTLGRSILRHVPNGVPSGGLFLRKHDTHLTTLSASALAFHPQADLSFSRPSDAFSFHLTLSGFSPRNVLKFLVAPGLFDASAVKILAVETNTGLNDETHSKAWLESAAVWRATFGSMASLHTLRVSGQAAVHLPAALALDSGVALFPALQYIFAHGIGRADRTPQTHKTWVTASKSARKQRSKTGDVASLLQFSISPSPPPDKRRSAVVYSPDRDVNLDWDSDWDESDCSTEFGETDIEGYRASIADAMQRISIIMGGRRSGEQGERAARV